MKSLIRTARTTGLWYLALGLVGMASFLLIRPKIYLTDDAPGTLDNLVTNSGLAHLGVGLELLTVVAQALCAVSFYKLFADINRVAAVAILAFGLVNSVAIMVSATFMGSALAVASDPSLAPSGDAAGTVGLLATLSSTAWEAGALFFGLWLIPMGWVVVTTRRMPTALGWILIAGGAGYLVSAVLGAAWEGAPSALVENLTLPASVGEFWMIGYLLWKGIRPSAEVTR